MSAESNASFSQPLRSIGAQDLINGFEYTKAAFIRKRGRRDRIFDRLGFLGRVLSNWIKWRQYFVVVSKGCLYIYASEGARNPESSVALSHYNSLLRTQETTGNVTWSFTVMPHRTTDQRCTPLSFSCISDRDRMDWMFSIKTEMILANGSSSSIRKPDDEGDYVKIEEPIIETPVAPEPTKGGYSLERNADGWSPEPEDDYSVIDETKADLNRRTLPPIPTASDKKKDKKGKTKGETAVKPPSPSNNNTSPKKLPDYVNERPKIPVKPNQALCRSMFYFEGGRDEAIEKLKEHKGEGTFLVRKSRTAPTEVLSVLTNEGVKEYKIQKEGATYMLNKNLTFTSMEDLLKGYQTNSLPNRTLTLSRPFMANF